MIKIPSNKVMRLRGGHEELHEQPQAIARMLHEEGDNLRTIAQQIAARGFDKVYFTGCGDSYFSGIAVQYALETWLKVPCQAIQALEYARYYSHFTDQKTLLLALSASGTTERTTEALLVAKAAGAFTVGFTNIPHTPIAMEPTARVIVRATRVGWPTQASTAPMAAMYLLGLELAKILSTVDSITWQRLFDELFSLPTLVEQTIKSYDEKMKVVAQDNIAAPAFFFAGGGPSFGTANFGAAKVKELSEDHAVALELEEYHHYRSIEAGEPLFLVAPQGQSHDRAIETAQDARSANGKVYAMIEEGDDSIAQLADVVFTFPQLIESLSPIPYVIPLHLFADHLAGVKGMMA